MCIVIVLFDDVLPFLIHFGILWGDGLSSAALNFKKKLRLHVERG